MRGTAGEARAAQTRANREETERELSKTLRESSEKMVALVNLLKEMHGAETGAQRVAAEMQRLAQGLVENDTHMLNVLRSFVWLVCWKRRVGWGAIFRESCEKGKGEEDKVVDGFALEENEIYKVNGTNRWVFPICVCAVQGSAVRK